MEAALIGNAPAERPVLPAMKKQNGKDHIFAAHEIVDRVETPALGSWVLKRQSDSTWWCRVTAASGRLMIVGDFEPIIFGVCSASNPRAVVAWIGECPEDDTYYPPQKAEIGMWVRISKTARANGIKMQAVMLALAAVRRLHTLLEQESKSAAGEAEQRGSATP